MQIFLTRMSFFDTAEDLDVARLALAAQQSHDLVMDLLYDTTNVFERNEPIRAGWAGFEVALAAYSAAMSVRLSALGVSTGNGKLELAQEISRYRQVEEAPFVRPPWIEDTDVLRSHRSNLIRRWPKFSDRWKGTPTNMPYIWPFVDADGGYKLMLSKYDKGLLTTGERVLPSKIRDRISNL